MSDRRRRISGRHRGLFAVTVIQAVCAFYFMIDVAFEFPDAGQAPMHPVIELLVVMALFCGTWLGIAELRRLLRERAHMQRSLQLARGAFAEVVEAQFDRWQLTPAERDVALLAIKGLSVAEIAKVRQTREGTIKAQSAAVYRKAGVTSRVQLLAHFVEDLMAEPVESRGTDQV